MPELPEVETVTRELTKYIKGKTIDTLEVYWNKSYVSRSASQILNRKILDIQRHGKYIIIHLETSFLVCHLRMTGQFIFSTTITSVEKHDRIVIRFKDNSELKFKDVRKFGRVYHLDNAADAFQNVGRDAVKHQWKADEFYQILQRRKMGIKSFLLSQKYIAGIGNIYADEALFVTGLHPLHNANQLSKAEAKKLLKNINFILNAAIDNMGTTISDYRDVDGNAGKMQNFLNVYQQNGKPCKVCSTPITKQKIAGRSSHYCPNCQRQ
jgi:formamidopyrimidine-DNA glycosylase